jgi:hypothetical protein
MMKQLTLEISSVTSGFGGANVEIKNIGEFEAKKFILSLQ